MTDLAVDTAVEQLGDGRFRVSLSRDWEIWGPMGGYVASCALRAAGAHSGRARPASIVGHFLSVANFDSPVDIECVALRNTRRADSIRATVTQNGKAIFEGMIWAVDEHLDGLEHSAVSMPASKHWSSLKPIQEVVAEAGEEFQSSYEFWNRMDQRFPEWMPNWNARSPLSLPPVWDCWLRFREISAHNDAWIDACRSLILVDLGAWPAANGHHNSQEFFAPSIDIACEFVATDPSDWLFVHCESPAANDGLIAGRSDVFSDDGRLVATGISQLLCKEIPGSK